jgi:hypothetical protein
LLDELVKTNKHQADGSKPTSRLLKARAEPRANE